MKSLRIPTACASLALLIALHGRAAAASSEIQGPAILEHACGKTAVKHMGLVRAGNMVEAVKLGTQEMREEWKAMPEEDRLMMSVMLSKMSLSEADFSPQIEANGLLLVEGPSATLTVKQEHTDENGTSTSTMTQNFKNRRLGLSDLALDWPERE